MAELLLKVGTIGPDPRWQDGDVVCAWNSRMVSQRHLSIIAHPRLLPPGRRAIDSHAFDYLGGVCRFRFERISATEVRRTDTTGALPVEIFNNTANAQGERIDVGAYLARQLRHPNHAIFGAAGTEIWFGGRRDYATSRLDAIWTKVEARSGLLKADHDQFPITETEKRHFLPITLDDFSDATMFALLARDVSDTMEDGADRLVVNQRRVSHVDWENLPGMTRGRRAQVRDGGRSADHRRSLGNFDQSSVREKTLVGRRSNIRI